MQICATFDIKVVIKPMTIIKDFLTHVLTHDSAKNVQKAVIVSGNLGKKSKEKRHFRTTKPRKMALKWLMTASKGDEST